jgi:hypothetical protein
MYGSKNKVNNQIKIFEHLANEKKIDLVLLKKEPSFG